GFIRRGVFREELTPHALHTEATCVDQTPQQCLKSTNEGEATDPEPLTEGGGPIEGSSEGADQPSHPADCPECDGRPNARSRRCTLFVQWGFGVLDEENSSPLRSQWVSLRVWLALTAAH